MVSSIGRVDRKRRAFPKGGEGWGRAVQYSPSLQSSSDYGHLGSRLFCYKTLKGFFVSFLLSPLQDDWQSQY